MIFQGRPEKKVFQNAALFLAFLSLFLVFPPRSPYPWANQLFCLGILIPAFFLLARFTSSLFSLLFLALLSGPLLMAWVSAEILKSLDFFLQWGMFIWGLNWSRQAFKSPFRLKPDLIQGITAALIFLALLFWQKTPWKETLLMALSLSFIAGPGRKKTEISGWIYFLPIFGLIWALQWRQGAALTGFMILTALFFILHQRFLQKKVKPALLIFFLSFSAAAFSRILPFPVLLAGIAAGFFFKQETKEADVLPEQSLKYLILLFSLTALKLKLSLLWPVTLFFLIRTLILFFYPETRTLKQEQKAEINHHAMALSASSIFSLEEDFSQLILGAVFFSLISIFFLRWKKD